MPSEKMYPIHSGEYKKRDAAEEWANKLRKNGDIVEVKPATYYVVTIVGREK